MTLGNWIGMHYKILVCKRLVLWFILQRQSPQIQFNNQQPVDCNSALESSLEQKWMGMDKKIWRGLSSGTTSGSIAVRLYVA